MNLQRLRLAAEYYLRETLGEPVAIARFLTERQPERVLLLDSNRGISAANTLRWDLWRWETYHGSRAVRWFCRQKDGYRSLDKRISELENFTEQQTIQHWTCDIQEIEGLAASKSDLHLYASLDDFAISECATLIMDVSEKNLDGNLNHDEIRILHRPGGGGDSFARYLWDGKLTFLLNSGGSHHFAAARYIASRLRIPVPLSVRLAVYRIRSEAAQQLTSRYDLYALPEKHAHPFHEAMQSFKASYGVCPLPLPLHAEASLLLLPREESRSMKASTGLREAGVFEVGAYLRRAIAAA
jgi:hypothetical protein